MKPSGTRIAYHHSIKEKFVIYASFEVEPRAEKFLISRDEAAHVEAAHGSRQEPQKTMP
jgi:hypothetical protein